MAEQAQTAFTQGRIPEATALCLDVLELAPGHAQALKLLYLIRKAAAPTAADALLRRLAALNPNDFWAINELTLRLLARGALAEAEVHARNAVRVAPELAQSHHLMGMVMTEIGRPQVGEHHYRQALALADRRAPVLLANLALCLKNQGKMAEARAFYDEAMALDPTMLQTVLGWARLEEADRNFDAAGALLDKAEALAPGNQSVILARAVLHGRQRSYEPALAVLDEIARQRDGLLGPAELLEQGRLLDQTERYDDAWAAFVEGKRLVRERSGVSYMAEHAESLTLRLKQFFTARRLAITPRASLESDSPQPIFIVGFPRSGTTLVEQTQGNRVS